MNWRNRWRKPGPEPEERQALCLVAGREPSIAEVATFRAVLRSDEGADVRDVDGRLLVSVRVNEGR